MESAFISGIPKKRKTVALNRRIRILRRDNYTCQLCKKDLHEIEHPQDRVIDHKIPVSKGGDNKPENLWVLCKQCDKEKANKILDEAVESILRELELLRKPKVLPTPKKKKKNRAPEPKKYATVYAGQNPFHNWDEDIAKRLLKLNSNHLKPFHPHYKLPRYIKCIGNQGKENFCAVGTVYDTQSGEFSLVSFERAIRHHFDEFIGVTQSDYNLSGQLYDKYKPEISRERALTGTELNISEHDACE